MLGGLQLRIPLGQVMSQEEEEVGVDLVWYWTSQGACEPNLRGTTGDELGLQGLITCRLRSRVMEDVKAANTHLGTRWSHWLGIGAIGLVV